MTVHIKANCVRSAIPVTTRDGTQIVLELDMTPSQRFAAVKQLLGVGMSEQEAFEGMKASFPEWFEVTA